MDREWKLHLLKILFRSNFRSKAQHILAFSLLLAKNIPATHVHCFFLVSILVPYFVSRPWLIQAEFSFFFRPQESEKPMFSNSFGLQSSFENFFFLTD